MSDDLGIIDEVNLAQFGRNYYDEYAYIIMRQKIIDFIKDAPEPTEARGKLLEKFIQSAPDNTVREIYARMMSVAEAAETLTWKAKLQEYIKGNPPPPKYEADKGTRNPVQFLEDVWGEYMDHGVLYQDDLTSYDEKLIPAIYNYRHSNQKLAGGRLPLPKRDRTEAIVQRVVTHGPDSLEDVMRAIRAYARRGDREK